MRPSHELINRDDPGFPLVRQGVEVATRSVEILPPSDAREDALVQTQVTTRSPMGAVVYETGGILVDGGWQRVLGSGSLIRTTERRLHDSTDPRQVQIALHLGVYPFIDRGMMVRVLGDVASRCPELRERCRELVDSRGRLPEAGA